MVRPPNDGSVLERNRQLHMHKAEAKLNSVIRYFAKTTEPSDAIEEMVERVNMPPLLSTQPRACLPVSSVRPSVHVPVMCLSVHPYD